MCIGSVVMITRGYPAFCCHCFYWLLRCFIEDLYRVYIYIVIKLCLTVFVWFDLLVTVWPLCGDRTEKGLFFFNFWPCYWLYMDHFGTIVFTITFSRELCISKLCKWDLNTEKIGIYSDRVVINSYLRCKCLWSFPLYVLIFYVL